MRLFSLIAAVLLAACGTAQSTQYFVLPDSQYSRPASDAAEMAVKVYLADPLANGGLVYQTDAYHLNFARNHLWAAPLDTSIAANLSNRLNRKGLPYVFVPSPRSSSTKVLKVYVEAFQGEYGGNTVVGGYALWPDGRSTPFHIATPQQGDGYAAMVESLAQGIKAAADTIAGR